MADKFIIQHKKSKEARGTGPKLPDVNVLKPGEIAINYHKGVETISIQNDADEIVAFQNEILVSENEFKGTELTTAKLVIDESVTGDSVEIYTKAEVDGNFAKKSEIPSLEGYATESYVDDKIKDVDVTKQLSDYAKTSEVDSKLEDYYKKTETYSKEEVDQAIQGVDVSSQLVNYPDSAEYTSNSKEIQFKHNGNLLSNMTIDASEFVLEQVQVSDASSTQQGFILIDETVEGQEVEIYTKADVNGLVSTLEKADSDLQDEVKKKIVVGTEAKNEEGVILIDESDDTTVAVYTKAEVDAIIAKLKADNNLK